jgi:hypothetical protein
MKKIARTISLIWLCLAALGCDSSRAKKDETKSEAVITKTQLTIYPDAKSVILYVSADPQPDKSGRFIISHTKGIQLTTDQRKRFESAFYRANLLSGTNQREIAACFQPHHFFTYYDAAGRQIGEIQVCFCCNQVAMFPDIAPESTSSSWNDQDWKVLNELLVSMKVPADFHCDR